MDQMIIGRPTIRNEVFNFCRRLKLYGIKGIVSLFIDKVVTKRPRKRLTGTPKATVSSDIARRISEHDALKPEDLRIQSNNAKWSLPYQPSSEGYFRRALQHVRTEINDYVFVDIGSGKGFVLLLATEYPFKSIIGVEHSEALTSIALDNIRTYYNERRRCFNIQSVCADATEFILPPEPTVLYLFNPFQGPLMDRMIENIKQSLRQHPRDLWIVYVNPMENRKFRRSPEFKLIHADRNFSVFRSSLPMSRRCAIA